jgi:hypothetical protein
MYKHFCNKANKVKIYNTEVPPNYLFSKLYKCPWCNAYHATKDYTKVKIGAEVTINGKQYKLIDKHSKIHKRDSTFILKEFGKYKLLFKEINKIF